MSPGHLHFKLFSQVILMQVVQSPPFEKHRIDESQQESVSGWGDRLPDASAPCSHVRVAHLSMAEKLSFLVNIILTLNYPPSPPTTFSAS